MLDRECWIMILIVGTILAIMGYFTGMDYAINKSVEQYKMDLAYCSRTGHNETYCEGKKL